MDLFVLRFYGPVKPMGSCRARSVYLTTRLLGRRSPLRVNQYCAHSFARNWQLSFLNQNNTVERVYRNQDDMKKLCEGFIGKKVWYENTVRRLYRKQDDMKRLCGEYVKQDSLNTLCGEFIGKSKVWKHCEGEFIENRMVCKHCEERLLGRG